MTPGGWAVVRTAMSWSGSDESTVAGESLPSAKVTVTVPAPWTTCRAVRMWPWALMMTPDPRAPESRERPAPWVWTTTSDGRTCEKTGTPGAGWFLRSFAAVPTFPSTILPTSALLTDGPDESCTVAQTRAPAASARRRPRPSQARRRLRLGGAGGGPSPPSDSTPPDTMVGAAPYLIASTYCRFLGKRPHVQSATRARTTPKGYDSPSHANAAGSGTCRFRRGDVHGGRGRVRPRPRRLPQRRPERGD